MTNCNPTTDELLLRIENDPEAKEQLLVRHQDRLCRMVAIRLDDRLKARVDPSDVVQDVLVEASNRLPQYVKERPIAFYPWLRRLAWERIVQLYRMHVEAQRRSVTREQRLNLPLPDNSAMMLADVLALSQSSPSQKLERKQMKAKIRAALDQLKSHDRELLILRYLERLSLREIAEVLGSTEVAIKSRHVRALKRLGTMLSNPNLTG